MNILSELTSLFMRLDLPIETGVFTGVAPNSYVVITPITDTFELFADNYPMKDVQEVRLSLFCKGNYVKLKEKIIKELLCAGLTITERRYIEHEDDTKYHHYCIDVAQYYELEEE